MVKVGSAGEPGPAPDQAPAANFSANYDGLGCDFTDSSTDDGSITGWSWSFGDGGSSAERHPAHTYAGEGSYEVTLAATDNVGQSGFITKTVSVSPPVANTPPTARFTFTCTYLTCVFTDGSTDSDGYVAEWSWEFGDGGTSSERHPNRTYAAAGSYDLTLTATDDYGSTGQQVAQVNPTAPPSIVLAATAASTAPGSTWT